MAAPIPSVQPAPSIRPDCPYKPYAVINAGGGFWDIVGPSRSDYLHTDRDAAVRQCSELNAAYAAGYNFGEATEVERLTFDVVHGDVAAAAKAACAGDSCEIGKAPKSDAKLMADISAAKVPSAFDGDQWDGLSPADVAWLGQRNAETTGR